MIEQEYISTLEKFRDDSELLSHRMMFQFKNSEEAAISSIKFYEKFKNSDVDKRMSDEFQYYNYILSQMLYKIQEMKFYSDVNIDTSRRIISTNNDCISSVHLLIRDEIHLNVYMRSSDFDVALIGDLTFFAEIPYKFISYLESKIGDEYFNEITKEYISNLKNKRIKLNIMFGSLHRTI